MPKNNKEIKDKITAELIDLNGEKIGKTFLPQELFGLKLNPSLLSQYVYVYLLNQRSGTRFTKTRSDVIGSTRKIYRQKGTGRARHGDIKAPIFIGGGVAHGPKPYKYNKKISKKMRKLALFQSLSGKAHEAKIKIIKDLEDIKAKTKEMANILNRIDIPGKTKKIESALMVVSEKAENVMRSGRNIPYLTVKKATVLNAYDVLSHKNLLISKDALELLVSHFSGKKETADKGEKVEEKKSKSTKEMKKTEKRKISKKKKLKKNK